MQRQKIGSVMLYLPPRLLVVLEELKEQLGISRNAVVRALLSGTYLNLNDIERDFAVTYGVRNHGAHRLESRPIIYNRMRELTQSMLNALFFTIENLY